MSGGAIPTKFANPCNAKKYHSNIKAPFSTLPNFTLCRSFRINDLQAKKIISAISSLPHRPLKQRYG
jgi:hypothetical protein